MYQSDDINPEEYISDKDCSEYVICSTEQGNQKFIENIIVE